MPTFFIALCSVALYSYTASTTLAFMEKRHHSLLDAFVGLFGVSKNILFSSLISAFKSAFILDYPQLEGTLNFSAV